MGKHRKKRIPTVLYSIWRNEDDALLILDGTADECCELLGISHRTFLERLSRTKGNQEKYTIRKAKREDVERECEG
jgi:hypothetical protein